MCGIAGIISLKNSKKIATEALLNMSKQIEKRGPDDEGFLTLTNDKIEIYDGLASPKRNSSLPYIPQKKLTPNTFFDIGLVHRRLSILDLSEAGHQPLCDKSRKIWIAYNGEIYNFKKIRLELEQKGHNFFTNTDTEVFLNAYIEYGIDALNIFNGMFAFAILDLRKNKIFIGRDRLGIKPIFYFTDNEKLIFASNARAIFYSGIYPKKIDYKGLWLNLAYGFSVKPQTVYDKIFMLEPATYLELNLKNKNITKHTYWEIPNYNKHEKITDIEKATQTLNELFYDAVKYRLTADVEVATFLSGGIDSGLITTFANNIYSNIKAFTLTFPEQQQQNDELDRSLLIAKSNKLNQIILNIDTAQTIENFDTIVSAYEEPFPQLGPSYMLAQEVHRQGLKIILSGLGADEIFSGYGWYNSIKRWKYLRYLFFAYRFLPAQNNEKFLKLKLSRSPKNWQELYGIMFRLFPDKIIQQLLPDYRAIDSLSELTKLLNPQNRKFSSPVTTYNYYDIKFYLGSHNLYHTDQFFMEHSLEGRVPFLDHRIVEFAFKLDDKLKIGTNFNQSKRIVKKLAENYLPNEIIYKKKLGFNLPLKIWFNKNLQDIVNQNITELKNLHLFDTKGIDKILATGIPRYIWHLVMVNLWYKKFFK